MRKRHLVPALIFSLIAFVIYAVTAAPDLLYGDAGEFQFTLPLAGVGHPTGYPFYHLLGWGWERFFGGNPAWGANLLSALWGAVAAGVFYLFSAEAFTRLMARLKWSTGIGWLAGLSTMVFAANSTLWMLGTQAEVYTLHAAFVAAILGAALAVGRKDHPWPIWSLALLFGLGMTHHLTTILLAPALIIFLWMERPDLFRFKIILRTLPWVVAPLVLYAYIPLRAPASPWLYPQLTPTHTLSLFENTLIGNLRFILGLGFSSEFGAVPIGQQLHQAAQLYLLHFTWIGLGIILLGVLALAFEGEWALLGLTSLSFLLFQLFNLLYGIGDIATYYLPLYLIATLWLGMGLAYLVEWLTRMTTPAWRKGWLFGSILILILPGFLVQRDFAQLDRRQDRDARTQWEDILSQPLPEDALLVSNDRDEMVPLIYLQQIEGRAPHMLGLFPLLAPTSDWEDLNMTLKTALATGRPVFLIKPMPGVEALYRLAPVGGQVQQVIGPLLAPPDSFEAPYTQDLRWLGIQSTGEVAPGETLSVVLYWRATNRPQSVWHSFLHLVDNAGEKVAQAEDHRPGGLYLPSPLWRPGDVIVDRFELSLPPDLPSGQYRLLAGFYRPETETRIAEPLPVAVIRAP